MSDASRFRFRAWDGEKMVVSGNLGDFFKWDEDNSTGEYPLMQSTGLTDSAGVEIFEGDILRTDTDALPVGRLDVVVEWGEHPSPIGWYGRYNNLPAHWYPVGPCHINSSVRSVCRVIGNIHEGVRNE